MKKACSIRKGNELCCECDRLNLFGRDHAFLVPKGKSLPFPAKGPVFYLE